MICNELFVSSSGASAAGSDRVSVFVMEGDTVTLHTDVEMNQRDRMFWIFGDSRLAIINGDKHKICTDDECKERFKDRLEVNNQTGSLTIRDITIRHSGVYNLKNTTRNTDNIFSVTVHGVSAAERDDMKRKSVKEGESVTLDTRVIKKLTDLMRWYFNETLIAEISVDKSKICTDDECKERFRDRLKLDHQTGSLTITNTRTTDSGEYKLKISRSRFSIIRSFTVTVSDVSDSGSSSVVAVVVVVVVAVVLLLLLVAAVVFYKHKATQTGIRRQRGRQERRDQVRLYLQL
uniref:Immunoglobulin domain-containing protein n=1 Tax=Cyprinus carpio TaxID=7962 RepID=A0A8C2KWR0_CYPCA